MTIQTTTTQVVTCDHCGRVIDAGETWYQAEQYVSSAVAGAEPSGLTPLDSNVAQLCALDYGATRAAGTVTIALPPQPGGVDGPSDPAPVAL